MHHCLPALRAGDGSVVTFCGGGATAPLPRFDAYAASKAAVVRLTENLAPVIAPLTVNCVAPGFVATRLHEATLAAGREAAGADFYEQDACDGRGRRVPAAEAAELVALLLADVPFSGRLISAQWDAWRDPLFTSGLRPNRISCTLRRIDGSIFGPLGEAL